MSGILEGINKSVKNYDGKNVSHDNLKRISSTIVIKNRGS